jgi:hypothetical protein
MAGQFDPRGTLPNGGPPTGAPPTQGGWPAVAMPPPGESFVYPAWAAVPVPGYPATVRSPLQWDAYVRSQLGRGTPIPRLLAEMVPPGADYRAANAYLQGHRSSLRQRALIFFSIGAVVTAIGVLAVLGQIGNSGPDAYGVYKGALTILIIGLTFLGFGILRLARITRG